MAAKKKTSTPAMSDTSGQSLAGFKANNTPARAQQRRNFAMQPTPLNKSQQ